MRQRRDTDSDCDWGEEINRQKSSHMTIFKTTEKNQLWFIIKRDAVIWIWKKFISKILEWESCKADKYERKDFSLNKFTLQGLGTSSAEAPKVEDLSMKKEIKETAVNFSLI